MADNPIQLVFRFTRISFGLNSIPFILEGTLQMHMSLLTTILMDDTITTFKDLDTTIMLNNKLKMCLSEKRFELRKWQTNDDNIRDFLCQNEAS